MLAKLCVVLHSCVVNSFLKQVIQDVYNLCMGMWLSINSGRDYKMYSLTCNKSKSIPQGYAHVCQGWSSTKVVDLLMY